MNKFNCPSCKYVFNRDYIEGAKKKDFIVEGDKPPVGIHFSNDVKLSISDDKSWDRTNVCLFACPHCKTVIFDETF